MFHKFYDQPWNSTSSSLGADDASNLRKAWDLSASISGTLSAGLSVGESLSAGAKLNGGLNSSSSTSLGHDLSEYKRVASELSHSSNKEIRDAYSEGSSLSDTTSHTVQEAVSRSQALSDVMPNQSAINTNYSNDFTNYLHAQGLDPRNMDATQQTAMAQKFIDNNIAKQYGISTLLADPSTKVNNPTERANVDLMGLQRPDSNNIDVDGQRGQVQKSIDDFKDHQGNVAGHEIVEQGKTVKEIGKDILIEAETKIGNGQNKVN